LVLIGILLLVVVAVFIKVTRTRRRYKRSAQVEFNKVVADYHQAMDSVRYVQNLSVYLRQTAMHFYSREHVASLTGNNWLQFLDQTKITAKEENLSTHSETGFQSDAGRLLLSIPYNPDTIINSNNVEQLTTLVGLWVAALPITGKDISRQAV